MWFPVKIDKLNSKLEVCPLPPPESFYTRKMPFNNYLGIPQLVFAMSILEAPKSCISTINIFYFSVHLEKEEKEIKR